MSKITFSRLTTIIACVIVLGTFFSCSKNESQPNGGKAALYSFGPTGSKIGDTLRFIGVNLNQVASIEFSGEGAVVDKSKFTEQSPELIKLIVPATAEKGFVVLKMAGGDTIKTKTQLNLNVLTTITSVTANARPGSDITITGDYLNWVDRITFAKDKVVTDFVKQSANELVVTVPQDAQTGALIVHYGGTDSADIETADVLEVTLPLAQSFSPNPVEYGQDVTINGTDLDLVSKVFFTGQSAPVTTFESQSASSLVVKVPASAVAGKITLEAFSGETTVSDVVLSMLLPSITAMTPNPVSPQDNLTITGANLDLVASVAFVGVNTPVSVFESQSAETLVVKVPEDAVTGKVTLNVKNSTSSVKSANDLSIAGSSLPPVIIYDDALTAAWNGWVGGGWGGTVDVNNTSPVRSGSRSVKISFQGGGWGVPWQLGGANILLDGYTTLKISIYGGTGADGASVNIGFNGADGKTVTVKGGEWTDFSIPLTDISSATTLKDLYIKNYTPSGDFTVYIDNIGIY